jgi:hypothetical protein
METNHNASSVGHELCTLFEWTPMTKVPNVVNITKGPQVHEVQLLSLGLRS